MSLIRESEYKKYLAARGILKLLADLLTEEITYLHILEKSVFSSDISQGELILKNLKQNKIFVQFCRLCIATNHKFAVKIYGKSGN